MASVNMFKVDAFEVKHYVYKFNMGEDADKYGFKKILYSDKVDDIADILSYRGINISLNYEPVTLTPEQNERLKKLNDKHVVISEDILSKNIKDITTFIMFGFVSTSCKLEGLKELSYGYQAIAISYIMDKYDCLLKVLRKNKLLNTILYRNREITPDNGTLNSIMSLLNIVKMEGTPDTIDYRFEDGVIINGITAEMLTEMIKLIGNRIQTVRTAEYKTKKELSGYPLDMLVDNMDVNGEIIDKSKAEELFEMYYTETLKEFK